MDDFDMAEQTKRRPYRIEIPILVDDANLSVYAFRLYVHISRRSGKDGTCFEGTRALAEVCKMSVGQISAAKKELHAAGLITLGRKPIRGGFVDEMTLVDVWTDNEARYQSVHTVNTNEGEQTMETVQEVNASGLSVQEVNTNTLSVHTVNAGVHTVNESIYNEVLKEELHVASDDASAVPVESETKPAPKRSSKPKADDPPAPQIIRTALFDACQIAPTARREIKINAAATAKALWKAGMKEGKSDEQIADEICYIGTWCRKFAWQCRDGVAPKPSMIGDYSRQALDARPKPATNGAHVNGARLPDYDYAQLERAQAEQAEQRRIASARRQAAIRKAGAS